ncbi:Omp28-related outer membrane protein [Flagellimonas flava]|uniref:Outer membrane protein Omp28 n=1 Tax=Flagellimonas flava TaxID=570519 RepID=A0A1M5PKS4_9FLAO|nr:Omp28-related outer membrane protein [Allomuricauda flava]SHH02348.1 Outer membrane protein Omp28 [Allomuricauda flava]
MKTIKIKKIVIYTLLCLPVILQSCSKDDSPKEPDQTTEVLGCTDPDATNYNENATKNDDSCSYPPVAGCMDPLSVNYNADAVEDDGSCLYNCTDSRADNFNEDAVMDDGSCTYSGSITKQFTENPGEYTRKILLETFVGTWTGWSVDVPIRIEVMNNNYDDKIIVSNIYQGSPGLENELFYEYMDDSFDVKGFPAGLVNRRASITSQDYAMSRSEWEDNVVEQLDEVINTGLALSALINENDELEIFVEVGFSANEEGVALHVQLLENGMIVPQYNYYSYEYGDDFEGHPFYNEKNLINDYEHNNVIREALTPFEGQQIPNDVIAEQGRFQRMFKVSDLSNYNKDNLKIIAFVAKNGEPVNQKYALNAQQLSINGDGTLAVQDYD